MGLWVTANATLALSLQDQLQVACCYYYAFRKLLKHTVEQSNDTVGPPSYDSNSNKPAGTRLQRHWAVSEQRVVTRTTLTTNRTGKTKHCNVICHF